MAGTAFAFEHPDLARRRDRGWLVQAALRDALDEDTSGDIERCHALAAKYADDPLGYIRNELGWEPWAGTPDAPGQVEIIEQYRLALRQQLERLRWENEEIRTVDLQYFDPARPIQNQIRVEAGHAVGKSKIASGLVSHFFDCFIPAIVYTYAPTWEQIAKLLWKEIATDRRANNMPGRVLETCEIKLAANHFATGRATNNAGGRGTERAQGQHGPYLLFVLDEAEGVDDFVYDAIDSMSSGGIVMVLYLGNPRTRISRFHRVKAQPTVRSFRISCLQHPNVIAGREVVPNAVRRDYVEKMAAEHCDVVDQHSDDEHTFTLPYPVRTKESVIQPGTILRPDAEFLFRVLGRAPAGLADNTFVPVGRYEAATRRAPMKEDPRRARIGLDVARYGKDFGTLYIRHAGRAWRAAQFAQQDTNVYARRVKREALALAGLGVRSLEVRVDGGGGFGGGVIDKLKDDLELIRAFAEFAVLEVHFGGTPDDEEAYADVATEMYAHAAETLKSIALVDPPTALEGDLCERAYRWVNHRGVDVKRLEPKEEFRKPTRAGRSPDDGDGLVLAIAPDFMFRRRHPVHVSTSQVTV